MSFKKTLYKFCETLGDVPLIGPILKPKDKVALIRLSGIIADSGVKKGGISWQRYDKIFEEAFGLYKLKAVFLIINSPGGSPAQSALIANHIRRLSEDKEVPVYAFVEDVAASGGYWIACAADKIYALDVSIVGSIGVISASFGLHELINRHGVERRVYTSGMDKSFMDPFLPEDEKDVKRLKDLQEDLHELFIDWVKERRGKKLSGTKKTLFEGQFWSGGKAQNLGIIDGIDDAKSFGLTKYGEDIKFKEFAPEKGWLAALLGQSSKMNIAEDAAQALEARSIWSRFGL